jgi:DNA-3-methyladenine glycosylase I
MIRCSWAINDVLQIYHDESWGVAVFDDQQLFRLLCLEGQQAGLKWEMILLRFDAYDAAYCNFDVDYVAGLTDDDLNSIISDFNVIKYLLKQQAIRTNAKAFLKFFIDDLFSDYVWSFTGNQVVGFDVDDDVKKEVALLLSNDLKKKGFKFVGPTICYSFLEAAGVFNNHCRECYLYEGID